jgi:lysyl-tRNA synthetase, class II
MLLYNQNLNLSKKNMSIANTNQKTIIEDGIIEENDQVQARIAHLKEIENLVGNAYPNKFERTKISGAEDTITNIVNFAPVIEIVKELKENTPEGAKPDQELKAKLNEKLKEFGNVRISGRLAVPPRVMGKAAFVHLSDGKNRLQIYCRKEDFVFLKNTKDSPDSIDSTDSWTAFAWLDHGDFIGVEGFLFLTNTGELSVHVETLQFLSKALMPMPDKMHGIADPELRRRFRYADLIAVSLKIDHEDGELTTREVFERRAKLISGMRRYLDDARLHRSRNADAHAESDRRGGEAFFETHHNALDIPLYARIAPELYLKRLTVGGFEKVYELNRNFRNEGLSHKHNPEFTMLEFYCAYMDVNGMMDFAEAMIKESVQKATGGSLVVNYDDKEIDFSKFERLSMKDTINDSPNQKLQKLKLMVERKAIPSLNYPQLLIGNSEFPFTNDWLNDAKITSVFIKLANKMLKSFAYSVSEDKEIKISKVDDNDETGRKWNTIFEGNLEDIPLDKRIEIYNDNAKQMLQNIDVDDFDESAEARNVVEIFEMLVEEDLIQPTFIIDYPKSISPLSKASPENPQIAERFELFINGMECANGFSELNDPQEQYERFVDQMRERETGDEEAMVLDEDYIRALAYGMPPAAGIGIGIDRLVMLLTNRHSIRDVILFPHMRPERKDEEKRSEGEEEKK